MDSITIIGLDIAKTSFSAHCTDAAGKVVRKAQLKRSQVLAFFAAVGPCKVGIEACGSAHHWAREIAKFGHEVRLIPARRVKMFVIRQKNDAADARAITEAMAHPETRYVPVKSIEQQANLMLFKVCDLLVAQRTRLINALRGHFSEFGIVAPAGPKRAYELVDRLMKDDAALPSAMKAALRPLVSVLSNVSEEIASLERAIAQAHKADATAKRLATALRSRFGRSALEKVHWTFSPASP